MKRVFIIGGVVAAVLFVMVAALALLVMVSPVRAQVDQAIGLALRGQPIAAIQTITGLQLKDEKGILVAGVFTGSPADKAGLKRGDIILEVDGKAVNTRADLNGILKGHKAGDTIKLTVQRGDSQMSVNATLAEQPAVQAQNNSQGSAAQGSTPTPTAPKQQVPYLGIFPLGAGEFRGRGLLNGGQKVAGAWITQVAAGSPAEKAGLKAGEVITAVDGQQIGAQQSLSTLLASHKPGDSVKLTVLGADGAQREVTVALGENPQQQGAAWLGVTTGRMRGPGLRNMPWMPGAPNGGPFSRRHMAPGLAGHPGALIEQVTQGSPAEKAGLKSGQLIVSVDGKEISGPQALTDAISTHKPGDKVTLSVYDPQSSQTSDVALTLGDNPQKSGSAWMGISYTYIDMQQMQPGQVTPQPNNNGTTF